MALLSKSEYDKYLKQIQGAQKQVNQISSTINKPAPTGKVAGASTKLNAAQIGGASGVGFETPENQVAVSSQVQTASEQGNSKATVGQSNTGGGTAPTTMSREQASFALRGAGLEGLVDSKKFKGLSPQEGQRRIQEEKAKRQSQVTANTTFAFNPETIASTKKIVDRVGIGINDITNQPFDSKGTQQDKIKSALEASARNIASLFSSQEEYNNAVASNPQLQQTLDTYTRLGGDVQNIAGKITTPVVDNTPKTTSEYLANLSNPQANQEAEQKAKDELIPEKALIQDEIARQHQIPDQFRDLYFGSEEQVGILEMKKNQAVEEQRIIERKEKDAEISYKAKARLAIQKEEASVRVQEAEIEQNQLAAKNYMTGMLSKLGALKTTGNAPLALQTLDSKFQIQKQTLKSNYNYYKQEINISLEDALNKLETDTDEQVLTLEQDLTKDYTDITKEINKLQQAADKETFNLTTKYATLLRTRTTAYTKELKAEAEKQAKAYAKIAGGGLDLNALSNSIGGQTGGQSEGMEGQYYKGKGVLNPLGGFNKVVMTKAMETEVAEANLVGTDTIKAYVNLTAANRRLVQQFAIDSGKSVSLAKLKEIISKEKKTTDTTDTSGMSEADKLKAESSNLF